MKFIAKVFSILFLGLICSNVYANPARYWTDPQCTTQVCYMSIQTGLNSLGLEDTMYFACSLDEEILWINHQGVEKPIYGSFVKGRYGLVTAQYFPVPISLVGKTKNDEIVFIDITLEWSEDVYSLMVNEESSAYLYDVLGEWMSFRTANFQEQYNRITYLCSKL